MTGELIVPISSTSWRGKTATITVDMQCEDDGTIDLSIEVVDDEAPGDLSRNLTPDEARALAAALVHHAKCAERRHR